MMIKRTLMIIIVSVPTIMSGCALIGTDTEIMAVDGCLLLIKGKHIKFSPKGKEQWMFNDECRTEVEIDEGGDTDDNT